MRLINGLWICSPIDVNARSRYCHATDALELQIYESSSKKLSGCASNSLALKDLGHLRKLIIGIYKPSSIMKISHQFMKVTTQETLYHEDHDATLKHKCGKRIVTLSLLYFSLIFLFGPFFSFYGLFFYLGFFGLFYFIIFVRSLIPTCGGIIVSIILSSLGTML